MGEGGYGDGQWGGGGGGVKHYAKSEAIFDERSTIKFMSAPQLED